MIDKVFDWMVQKFLNIFIMNNIHQFKPFLIFYAYCLVHNASIELSVDS